MNDPRHEDDGLRIGELAELLGLTTRTLRYWEQRSLIPPARRTAGGYRLYGSRHVEAARGVGRLKQAGLGLDEILGLQRCLGSQPTALAGLAQLGAELDRRIEAIRGHIEGQRRLLVELTESRELLHSCNGCAGKPYDHRCVRCLEQSSADSLPDTLASILESCRASTIRSRTR